MLKKHLITMIILELLSITAVRADGFSVHANLGYATPKFSANSTNVWMNASMENQYVLTSSSQNGPLLGVGAGHDWNFDSVAFNLGASIYYLKTSISGINSPFINVPFLNAPTFNYSVTGKSYAVMLEPKLMLTTSYFLQPYIFGGLGVSSNQLNNYSEIPTNSGSGASPTQFPFASKKTFNFAYEIGIGMQHSFSIATYTPILALDYRYMNLGQANLGNATSTPDTNLKFGHLYSMVATLSLIWPF